MEKDTELLVERHREAAFQQGFATGFCLAMIGSILGVAVFVVGNYTGWWK